MTLLLRKDMLNIFGHIKRERETQDMIQES